MRVSFITASLGSGGAERVVSLLANSMAQRGHEIEIICLKYNDIYYDIDAGVRVIKAAECTKCRIHELFWLREYLKKVRPDVVIPFTEGVYCFTILSLLGSGIPVIASERLDPSAMSWNRKLLKKLLLPFADALVVQTQKIKDYFPRGIQKKTVVIYNPVNEQVYNLPVVKKKNQIISVARLYPQKNQKMMIDAFSMIADSYSQYQLVIYGEGPLRRELEDLIEEKDMKGRVLLPGRSEKIIEELNQSKIFCLSSDYEGMSNSMIEAICVGLPILTTRVSGTEELIKNQVNGDVVNVGDVAAFSSKLARLVEDEERQSAYSEKNKELSKIFRIDRIVGEWENVIEDIVSQKQ